MKTLQKHAALSASALKILQQRYFTKNEKGELTEDAAGLFKRVANAVARAELYQGGHAKARFWEKRFYDVISRLLFLPNSPTLMNAGTALNQLSACFVLPVKDSLEEIFETLKKAALIQQSGGGTGFNFSQLRPKNDLISKTGGAAAGPVAFMKIFDAATEYVKQGGKRRGANMGILNIDHPDIEEFINCKQQEGVLKNFNISVAIPDTFMKALEKKVLWPLIHPVRKSIERTIPAEKLWNDIINNAWKGGDPGVLFTGAINAANPTPALGAIEATNPCGEVPLLPYEACNLGSINLSRCTIKENTITDIDWKKLEWVINTGVRFLDNVIEINNYLFPGVREMVLGNRKIGLGVMGWADLLALMEIPYDSQQAIDLADKLMQFVHDISLQASIELAKERGVFANWQRSIYFPNQPVRNATRLSIAPTGTISIIAGASSSIEPLFALAYQRRQLPDGENPVFVNQPFVQYLRTHELYTKAILDHVMQEGSIQHIQGIPATVKSIFKTALEISPEWHLKHQAVFQKYVDNAVSKTINLPETATIADVSSIYETAWKNKLKGITVFRYNSRHEQVLRAGIHTVDVTCKVCIE